MMISFFWLKKYMSYIYQQTNIKTAFERCQTLVLGVTNLFSLFSRALCAKFCFMLYTNISEKNIVKSVVLGNIAIQIHNYTENNIFITSYVQHFLSIKAHRTTMQWTKLSFNAVLREMWLLFRQRDWKNRRHKHVSWTLVYTLHKRSKNG